MTSSFFCGVPYTPGNQWELALPPPPTAAESTPLSAETPPLHDVVPHFTSLDFYVDIYNEHHTCCWPRTLFDTHVSRAAQAAQTQKERTIAARQRHRYNDEALKNEDEEHPVGSSAEYVRHVQHVAEQLFQTQRERVPRAPQARRIAYHRAVPPVLRYSNGSDSLLYVLQGKLELRHRCRPTCVKEGDTGTPKDDARGTSENHTLDSRHAQHRSALARDVFPPFVVMAPSRDCAGFVDSEAGSASAATSWQAAPLVLALESMEQTGQPSQRSGGATLAGGAKVEEEELWCATYSPFTWICNPLGNANVSSLIRSTAAVQHVRRRAPHGLRSTKSTRGSVAVLPTKEESGTRAGGQEVPVTDLPPLQVGFDLYRTCYTSHAAQQHILSELEAAQVYRPHITQTLRFGLGSGGTCTEEEKERAERLAASRARRPRQILRLLDATLPRTTTITRDTTVRKVTREENVARDTPSAPSSPPLKAPRTCADAHIQGHRSGTSRRDGGEEPCVRLARLGTLRTVAPIPRERCALPRCTTLVSVLRRTSHSVSADELAMDVGSDGGEAQRRGGWPLRIGLGSTGVDSEAEVVHLSSLSTLHDLAEALRRVSRGAC